MKNNQIETYFQEIDLFQIDKKEVQNNFTYSALIGTTSFLFAVCWQFNQFVFLLQGTNYLILYLDGVHFMCPGLIARTPVDRF